MSARCLLPTEIADQDIWRCPIVFGCLFLFSIISPISRFGDIFTRMLHIFVPQFTFSLHSSHISLPPHKAKFPVHPNLSNLQPLTSFISLSPNLFDPKSPPPNPLHRKSCTAHHTSIKICSQDYPSNTAKCSDSPPVYSEPCRPN